MTEPASQVNMTFGLTRKSLEAVRIHACPHCEAPGIYKSDERTKQFWPGCYREGVLNGQTLLVGDTCPNCGGGRVMNSNLGELSASMPKLVWYAILGFKWCVIKVLTLKKRLLTA